MKDKREQQSTAGVAVADVSFGVIKRAVARQFELMRQHTLYRVSLTNDSTLNPDQRRAATGDRLWEAYLAAFPEGANPVYRERTGHDCSCCRHFVKTMGAVVAVIDGRLVSIWGGDGTGTFYDVVMGRMDALVTGAAVDNVFLHREREVGEEKTFEQVVSASEHGTATGTRVWEHFHLRLPASAVVQNASIGSRLSEARATFDVLKRGLEELSTESVDTVLELIAQNSLYRGEEHKAVLTVFRRLKVAWADLADNVASSHYEAINHTVLAHSVEPALRHHQDIFVWSNIDSFAARVRNTAIGTLLQDLSVDVDLEDAVKKFETMVAPTNYKRPTALVTKAMVAKARERIEELGLTSALERRYATIDDITVNNILFAVRRTTRLAAKDVFDGLATRQSGTAEKRLDKVEEIPIEKFLSSVLPKAESLEVMVENRHAGSFVSLVAPVDPGAKNTFKWPNNFSWSYAGDVADSIKERVKKAGGSVVGDLCCRLAWDYADDLDFHMLEPLSRRVEGTSYRRATHSLLIPLGTANYHIHFGNRRILSPNGGVLDLDANGADGLREDPAENIYYADKGRMAEGVYELFVHNYARRSSGAGFEVEVEFGGTTHSFVYDKALRTNDKVIVARITYSKAGGFEVQSDLKSTQVAKTIWGVQTGTFHKVNVVTLSPNYWLDEEDRLGWTHDGIGNKHWFFMLEGCRNEGTARGFYNEFLASELEPHRKVMEMVGARMRTDESDRQLSGLGFSSTRRDSVLARVKGSFNRVVKVVF